MLLSGTEPAYLQMKLVEPGQGGQAADLSRRDLTGRPSPSDHSPYSPFSFAVILQNTVEEREAQTNPFVSNRQIAQGQAAEGAQSGKHGEARVLHSEDVAG